MTLASLYNIADLRHSFWIRSTTWEFRILVSSGFLSLITTPTPPLTPTSSLTAIYSHNYGFPPAAAGWATPLPVKAEQWCNRGATWAEHRCTLGCMWWFSKHTARQSAINLATHSQLSSNLLAFITFRQTRITSVLLNCNSVVLKLRSSCPSQISFHSPPPSPNLFFCVLFCSVPLIKGQHIISSTTQAARQSWLSSIRYLMCIKMGKESKLRNLLIDMGVEPHRNISEAMIDKGVEPHRNILEP